MNHELNAVGLMNCSFMRDLMPIGLSLDFLLRTKHDAFHSIILIENGFAFERKRVFPAHPFGIAILNELDELHLSSAVCLCDN